MRAYVLIESAVGKANSVGEGVKKLTLTDAAVVAVDAVTGPYDVIARGEAADLDELAKSVVMPVQAVEGVTRTLTCPILQL